MATHSQSVFKCDISPLIYSLTLRTQLLPNKTATALRFILNSSVITLYRTDTN
ncbi:hypothetical protein G3810_004232 [Escherichia coli]|nr:hypothetical protein [Escherichia coli]EFI9552959.1 hypothetical protein [Escherichia coli]